MSLQKIDQARRILREAERTERQLVRAQLAARRNARKRALQLAVKGVRERAALSQDQLARRLGHPQSHIGKIESGQRPVDVLDLMAIADAVKLDPREILWLIIEHAKRIESER